MKIGDMVAITGEYHPWIGHTGEIIKEVGRDDSSVVWHVLLDNGEMHYAAGSELTVIKAGLIKEKELI